MPRASSKSAPSSAARPGGRRSASSRSASRASTSLPLGAPLVVGASARLECATFTATASRDRSRESRGPSETPAVATVDAAGVVTGLAPGRARVPRHLRQRRRRPSRSRSCAIRSARWPSSHDRPRCAPATSSASSTMASGEGGAALSPAVQWTVSGGGARIDADGGFVAERPGTYLVTAAAGTRMATASVVVTPRHAERKLEVVGRTPIEEFQTLEQWVFGHYLYVSSALAGSLVVYDIAESGQAGQSRHADLRRAHHQRRQRDRRRPARRADARRRLEPQERHRLSRHVDACPSEGAVRVHRDGDRRRAQRVHRRPLRLSHRRCDRVDARDQPRGSGAPEGSRAVGSAARRPAAVRRRVAFRSPAAATCTTSR